MLQPTNILTDRQLLFLKLFGKSDLNSHFYLTGGTALCGFYIPYRCSEDLDFFSQKEVDSQAIIVWLKSVKRILKFEKFDIQVFFNRNLIFIIYKDETLKTEFTYFPFPQKNDRRRYKNIVIDSLEDIALNKLFTIYQNPRLRDYMDLYVIIQKENYSIGKLIADAKVKFDWHIDAIQLGSQLLKVKDQKDKPKLIKDFDYLKMETFYKETATNLQREILQ